MKTTRKKLVVFSLLIAVVLTVGTAKVQVTREVGCFADIGKGASDCVEEVQFGGIPLAVTPRGDINSPANRSTFDDGFNVLALLGNVGIYYILVLSVFVTLKE